MADSSEAQATRTSINSKVLLLDQKFENFKGEVNSFKTEFNNKLDNLTRSIETWMHSRQPRLNVWIPTIGTVLVGFWFVLNLQLTSATKSLSDSVGRLEVTATNNSSSISRTQDEQNRKYDNLSDRIGRDEITQNRLDAATTKSLVEVETQLRAMENYANLQRKYDNTIMALLWHKAYGEEFPVFEHYPSISQHDGYGYQ